VGVASKKKEDGMDIFPWGLVGGAIALVAFAFLASQMVFTTHTKQAAVIEKFGKFDRIAGPGLNFKVPLIEKVVCAEDLNMQLMDVPVMSKTKDDATVTVPVDDPEDQIKAHVENVILSYIPKINLDDTYQQEDQIARRIKESLATVMALLMMTQYFDALRDIGAQSNTILLPHSPSAVSDLYMQLRKAVTAGNLAAAKSMEKPPEKK
jgi:SPFH domain / Band 7 family